MKRFSQLFLCLTVVLLLLWQLPWCYTFFVARPSRTPFSMYSCVIGDFVSIGYDEGVGTFRRDRAGNHYTQEETDSILPLFYVRQLMADERFPDSIMGVAVTPREVQHTNFNFRISATDINTSAVPLYPLLESMSKRVELKMPDDVFRITPTGIEFIVMESNSIDEAKSRRFTEALTKKSFRFPARYVAGNPTTRKEYDEGYLILDDEGKLFHLKQMQGRPYVRAIELPQGVQAKHLFITEFSDRKTLGYLTDANHAFYVLMNKTYEVIKTGLPAYNPEKDNLTIFGNMFDWTVSVEKPEGKAYYALNAEDYSLIESMQSPDTGHTMPGLHFTSYRDEYVKPRFF
ncbi:DUF4857 domain-containing protein [Bacteroides heparinolyticus]|uniref:DUF4857 domain-containing protein n=2 Tax=Prevotella heparinolytica TaxID=28113 RepID=UPI0023F81BF6|nr:DUF4857 domain-containing protein [Bacteroides heparinolyticus]MCI6213076.1 DUF4857 domain-containing protein [Bacteroides heparinolyticus]